MPKRPTILCVDDLAPNLRVRTMMLEQFGCETIGVEDHQSALQAVAERKIDLIVLDYHLANGETGKILRGMCVCCARISPSSC